MNESIRDLPRPARGPVPAAGSGPQLVTQSKLMQQYRIAAAVHGGGSVVAVRNGAGEVEIFTVGTDGTIWNFYPDPTSETGYGSVSTGLVGSAIAAGVDAGGRLVVFAASNLVLSYVRETGQSSARWSAQQPVQLPLPPSPLAIAAVYAQQIGGALYVGALTRVRSASPGNVYAFAYSAWDATPGVFTATTMTLSTLNCVWSGSAPSTAQFTCLDTIYLGYDIATQSIVRYPVTAVFKTLAVDSALDAAANNQYFAIFPDGNLYRMTGGDGKAYGWAQLTTGMSFRQLRADRALDGGIHLFALATNNRIYHLEPASTSGSGWTDPVPIHGDTALFTVAANDVGNIELFAIGTAQASLTHLIRQQAAWQATAIEVPTSGEVEEYVAYVTDLSVHDATGAPMPNAAVEVWASSQTQLSVNGAIYVVDAQTPAQLSTTAAGTLSITQQTGTLACAALEINIVSAMPPGQSLAVRQYAGVQARLAQVSGDDLLNARDASGAYLLADEYRTKATTDSLAKAFNACMQLAGAGAVSLSPAAGMLGRRSERGAGLCRRGEVAGLNRLRAAAESHWQLSFAGSAAAFRALTPGDAQRLLLEKRARYPVAQELGGVFDWIEDIGDFIEGVVEGIVEVVDAVITTIGDAIHATITFIVDGVTYLFETVVQYVEQAFDLVEAFLAKVKVVFEKAFEWLGFVFSWDDILRTHEALAYALDQFLAFLPGAAAGLQRFFDQGIGTAQSQVDAVFDALVAKVGGGTLGGYAQEDQPSEPDFLSAASNNLVFNAVLANIGSAGPKQALAREAAAGSGFDAFVQQLQQFVDSVKNIPAFGQAMDYMTQLGSNPDQMFTQLVSALLRIVQGIVKAMLAGTQLVVDSLLQLVQSFIGAVQQLLTAAWNIPFVSDFYAWLTKGATLNLRDLFALIVAIPSTVLYKVLKGAAPFPDAASVDRFRASFNAQSILANSGLGGSAGIIAAAPQPPAARDTAASGPELLLGIAGLLSSWTYAGLSAAMDVKPMTGAGQVDPLVKTLTKVALAGEVLAQAASCPWIFSRSGIDCSSADGADKVAWIYESMGVLLDCGFTVYESAFPENNDTYWGVGVAVLYGCGHVVTVGVVGSHMSGFGLTSRILQVIPEVGKLLRLPQIETATSGWSLVGIAALDGLLLPASAIFSFVDLISSSAPTARPAAAAVPSLA